VQQTSAVRNSSTYSWTIRIHATQKKGKKEFPQEKFLLQKAGRKREEIEKFSLLRKTSYVITLEGLWGQR
jgi:hypothetical protein